MMTSAVRVMRDSLLACLLTFVAMAVLAAASYTPEERRMVDRLPQFFEAKCLEGAAKAHLKDSPEAQSATDPWMEAMRGPNGACACVSSEVMRHMSPELLHSPDAGEQMKGFATDAGATCVGRVIRTSFPAICPTMMRNALPKDGFDVDSAAYIPELCRCVQHRMDALSTADLKPYMQAMMAPTNRDRSAADVARQSLPPAFQQDMRECGYAAVNRMMDAETAAQRAAHGDPAASTPGP